MERYHDNTTPEPQEAQASNDNFKTPDGAGEHHLSIIASAYPTPPTDDDEISISCGTKFLNNNSSELFKQIDGYYHGHYSQYINNGDFSYSKIERSDENTLPSAERVAEAALQASRYKRRSRTTYTKQQLDILEATFDKTHYPDVAIVDRLSNVLNLATERISIWFQNRRARHKKEKKIQYTTANVAQTTGWKAPPDSYSYQAPVHVQPTYTTDTVQQLNYFTNTNASPLKAFNSNGYQNGLYPNNSINYNHFNLLPQIEELKNTHTGLYNCSPNYMQYYQ